MRVFTHAGLLRSAPPLRRATDRAVLLEGAPSDDCGEPCDWLDRAIDARFAEIDQFATTYAEVLAGGATFLGSPANSEELESAAFAYALKLRYALVKLMRVVAYFDEVRPLVAGEHVQLFAESGRDEDYARLFEAICQQRRARLDVRWTAGEALPGAAGRLNRPANRRWRRTLAAVNDGIDAAFAPASDTQGGVGSPARVALCGNPAHLDPVCRELLQRGQQVWWFYDRFALKSWLRWRRADARQYAINSSAVPRTDAVSAGLREKVVYRRVDLTAAASAWLTREAARTGYLHRRLGEGVTAFLDRVRPTHVVVDEDATPLPRTLIAAAKARQVATAVVQHGVPCVRFGFAPPVADRVFAWGESSRRQFERWGIPRERIVVTGSPKPWTRSTRHATRATWWPVRRRRRLVLLATVPPRDDRPDAVSMQLNSGTYDALLDWVAQSAARVPGGELIVKLHPRTRVRRRFETVLARHPQLKARIVQHGPLRKVLRKADCAIACVTSAGVEAALAGVPVVQLIPNGARELLPADEWGCVATADSPRSLDVWLGIALAGGARPDFSLEKVVAAQGAQAARNIVDALLAEHRDTHGDGGSGIGDARVLAATAAEGD